MKTDDVIDLLEKHEAVEESYVLIREMKMYLKVDADFFHPKLGIRIWKSKVLGQYPYHFTVSHHVHTPTQAGPYYPSRTEAESEEGAIREAISTILVFLKGAIQAGHQPSDDWLIPNEDF